MLSGLLLFCGCICILSHVVRDTAGILCMSCFFLFVANVWFAHAPVPTRLSGSNRHPHSLTICKKKKKKANDSTKCTGSRPDNMRQDTYTPAYRQSLKQHETGYIYTRVPAVARTTRDRLHIHPRNSAVDEDWIDRKCNHITYRDITSGCIHDNGVHTDLT